MHEVADGVVNGFGADLLGIDRPRLLIQGVVLRRGFRTALFRNVSCRFDIRFLFVSR
jgi:hypothetical protein